ncbi:MAG: hypothetical protein EOP45_15015, partial [Sphingobacteriaceae bacterium]
MQLINFNPENRSVFFLYSSKKDAIESLDEFNRKTHSTVLLVKWKKGKYGLLTTANYNPLADYFGNYIDPGTNANCLEAYWVDQDELKSFQYYDK